jgi:hypothetical protein
MEVTINIKKLVPDIKIDYKNIDKDEVTKELTSLLKQVNERTK